MLIALSDFGMAQHLSADDHAGSFRGSPLYMVSTHNWDTGNCVLHVFVCSVISTVGILLQSCAE